MLQVQNAISGIESNQEAFEFHREGVDKLRSEFSVSIAAILMRMACFADEIAMREPFLPPAGVPFVLARKADASMDSDLSLFLKHTKAVLTEGADSQRIATESGFSLNRVRFSLFKLRELGAVIEQDLASVPVGSLKLLLVEPNSRAAHEIKLQLGKALPLVAVANDLHAAKTFLGGDFKFDIVVSNIGAGDTEQLVRWSRSAPNPPVRFFRISDEHETDHTSLPRIFNFQDLEKRLPRAVSVG